MLDSWWLQLPEAARPQIRERFMESAPAVHLGGFFELYMHEVLRRVCSEVEVDIGNDDLRRRRPDLRAVTTGTGFGVEVTAILGDDAVDPKDRARVDQLYDALNARLQNRDFLLHINLRQAGPQTPGKKLVAEIDRWLDPLDPDVETERQVDGKTSPQLHLEHRGWVVGLEATPLQPDLRNGPALRVIGSRVEGFEVASIDDRELDTLKPIDDIGPLSRSLSAKAGHRYELREEPFVIVSAVLTVTELTPGSSALVEPCLWLNPWAQRPLPTDSLPWRKIEFRDDGRPVETPATRTTAEILEVGLHWPYEL
jgi:hypothetical protein